MSSNQLERIKGLRVKKTSASSTNYSDLIPFGTQGQLIDMFSGLDLEEELKIGGDRYIEIEEKIDQSIIKEWYYSEPKGDRSKSQMSSLCNFSVEIIFTEGPADIAIDAGGENQVLVEEHDNENPENENLIVIQDEELATTIEVSLYKGDLEDEENRILIHNKTIIINPPNNQGIETLEEILEREGGEQP